MAPQLPSDLRGRALPSQLSGARGSKAASVATPVEANPREQAAQACRVQRVTRYRALCAVHGVFDIDEFSQQAACPGEGRPVVGCATRAQCSASDIACGWPVCASGRRE